MLLKALAYFLCIATLIAVLDRFPSFRFRVSVMSIAGGCLVEAGLLAWSLFDAFGGVESSCVVLGALVPLSLQALAVCVLLAPIVKRKGGRLGPFIRILCVLLAIPLGVFFVEYPYSSRLFEMEWDYFLLNMTLVGGFVIAVWFFFQRRMSGIALGMLACLAAGLTDYVLMLFKGTTVLPSDLMALSTAAEVAGGYVLVLKDQALLPIFLYVLFLCVLALLPNPKVTRIGVAFNVIVGALFVVGLVQFYDQTDIEEDYGVKVDVWSNQDSYMTYGAVTCFLQRMQEVHPDEPDGYSTTGADNLVAELAAAWDESHPGYPQTLAGYLATQQGGEAPSVLCIMDESFCNLAMYDGVEGYDGTDVVDALDTVSAGTLYVSARGGGTCNTEFEFLTGSSLGMIGGGVYPYMFYDLSGVSALPNLFSNLGYATTAIHPCEASNWRRDIVYGQLGFDCFLSQTSFEGADTLRGKVTDRSTYELALQVLQEDGPQFVFDVTYMGHGGYTSGELSSYPYDDVTVNGTSIEGMSEYLSLMDAAEDDVAWLLESLSSIDKHVVVVFFGDHQPGFNEEVSAAAYGDGEDGLDRVQQRFSTQYFVWANYDLGEASSYAAQQDVLDGSIGVNYLGALAMYEVGLPLSDLQKAVLKIYETMPVTNLNGYRDASGSWYWNGADSEIKDVYDEYATLQYRNLFDHT